MILKEIQVLHPLVESLKKVKDLKVREDCLFAYFRVQEALSNGSVDYLLPFATKSSSKRVLYSLVAIGQQNVVFAYASQPLPAEKICSLLDQLKAIDRFYESLGGIVGYHYTALKLLVDEKEKIKGVALSRVDGIDLTQESDRLRKALISGIRALPEMGEMYPIGGLGVRLNVDNNLPVAFLPFCGKTLLEGLVRDVQAREFLYYRLFGEQVTIPIAMMTSLEKQNRDQVLEMCKKKEWFGRSENSFFLFSQLSVPVLTKEGRWSMKAPLELNREPGGHGAIWHTANEKGVFTWFQEKGKRHLLIRQINNPIGGIDQGLIVLAGMGKKEKKTLGFASCERYAQAAEGILVLIKQEGKKRLSNIEYTEFQKWGIEDHPLEGGYSLYPANTNILYADLKKLLPTMHRHPLQRLMINMKTKAEGRLESMMQTISDALAVSEKEELPTFLTYNARKRTLSTAKKGYEQGKRLLETPLGAFYDLLFAGFDLLENHCKMTLPPFPSQEEYLKKGPSFVFLYHPALGPLYSLIQQKIQGGRASYGSELQLEIADLLLQELDLDGTLLIQAKQPLGNRSEGVVHYSNQTGKCVLKKVRIKNRGIDRAATTSYWTNEIHHLEALTIILEGESEFYAENVTFQGNQTFSVPDKERWIIWADEKGEIFLQKERANWVWQYRLEEGMQVRLSTDLGNISHTPSSRPRQSPQQQPLSTLLKR